MEEVIRTKPDYFIWAVETFQDITREQAELFRELYGESLPEEVIRDVPPYVFTKDSPEGEYEQICMLGHL